jgi:probable rRNA maturation factor
LSYEVEISNQQMHVEIDEALLRQVAERTLAEEQVAAAGISIAIVDDATIHRLNRQYLKHDYETDVLSFLLEAQGGRQFTPGASGPRGPGKRIEGELILSAETAARQAPEFLWSPHDELVLYLVHGLLHLVGYDDLDEVERRVMRAREGAMLSLCNLRSAAATAGGPVVDRSPSDGMSGADP